LLANDLFGVLVALPARSFEEKERENIVTEGLFWGNEQLMGSA
jgi:hypothetical protein